MQRNDRRAAQLGTSLAPHGACRDLEDGSHVREARPAIVLRAKMGPGAPRFDTRVCYLLRLPIWMCVTVSRFRSARSSSRSLLVA